MKAFLFLILAIFSTDLALAGNCDLTIDREACPGREQEAFDPYDGKNPTQMRFLLTNAEACQQRAAAYSKIIRVKILKKITVTSTFNGIAQTPVSNELPCGITARKNRF